MFLVHYSLTCSQKGKYHFREALWAWSAGPEHRHALSPDKGREAHPHAGSTPSVPCTTHSHSSVVRLFPVLLPDLLSGTGSPFSLTLGCHHTTGTSCWPCTPDGAGGDHSRPGMIVGKTLGIGPHYRQLSASLPLWQSTLPQTPSSAHWIPHFLPMVSSARRLVPRKGRLSPGCPHLLSAWPRKRTLLRWDHQELEALDKFKNKGKPKKGYKSTPSQVQRQSLLHPTPSHLGAKV